MSVILLTLLLAAVVIQDGRDHALQPSGGAMVGGGDVSIVAAGTDGLLRVIVTGPRDGLASLCLGNGSRIRILHASAAVGEATYVLSGGKQWVLESPFSFELRDGRAGPPSPGALQDFFTRKGWIANASRSGARRREFTIQQPTSPYFLGVTFLTTEEPVQISHWPSTMADDCRAIKVAHGWLPETAMFAPSTWHPIK